MKIEKIDTKSEHLSIYDDTLLNYLYSFKNGVRELNKELNVVQDSINLALIKTNIDEIVIEFSARSMNNENLKNLKDSTKSDLEKIGCNVNTYGKYPAWNPDINSFTDTI